MSNRTDLISVGNAVKDGKQGWFVGQFVPPPLAWFASRRLRLSGPNTRKVSDGRDSASGRGPQPFRFSSMALLFCGLTYRTEYAKSSSPLRATMSRLVPALTTLGRHSKIAWL